MLSRFVRAPQGPRDAARFVELYLLDVGAREYFSRPEFVDVVRLARDGKWGDAARKFREVTGADVKMSVYAAEIAARM